MHLSTSPVPLLGKMDPQLVARGLGTIGNYEISDVLWHELAPVNFEASVAEFSLPRDVYSSTREDMVLPMVFWVLDVGVVNIMDRGCPLRATCWPFIIPKTTEKVSLIFNLVNEGLQRSVSFSLDGWEQISHGVRMFQCPREVSTLRAAELWGWVQGVRLATYMKWPRVLVGSDSTVA